MPLQMQMRRHTQQTSREGRCSRCVRGRGDGDGDGNRHGNRDGHVKQRARERAQTPRHDGEPPLNMHAFRAVSPVFCFGPGRKIRWPSCRNCMRPASPVRCGWWMNALCIATSIHSTPRHPQRPVACRGWRGWSSPPVLLFASPHGPLRQAAVALDAVSNGNENLLDAAMHGAHIANSGT
jgi:hypothetical protein